MTSVCLTHNNFLPYGNYKSTYILAQGNYIKLYNNLTHGIYRKIIMFWTERTHRSAHEIWRKTYYFVNFYIANHSVTVRHIAKVGKYGRQQKKEIRHAQDLTHTKYSY